MRRCEQQRHVAQLTFIEHILSISLQQAKGDNYAVSFLELIWCLVQTCLSAHQSAWCGCGRCGRPEQKLGLFILGSLQEKWGVEEVPFLLITARGDSQLLFAILTRAKLRTTFSPQLCPALPRLRPLKPFPSTLCRDTCALRHCAALLPPSTGICHVQSLHIPVSHGGFPSPPGDRFSQTKTKQPTPGLEESNGRAREGSQKDMMGQGSEAQRCPSPASSFCRSRKPPTTMSSTLSPTDFDSLEIQGQYSDINNRWDLPDSDWDNDSSSARLFERSRIKALAGEVRGGPREAFRRLDEAGWWSPPPLWEDLTF